VSAARIVCLGDLMVDVLTRLSEPLHIGSDTPAEVQWTGGGSAANTAAWLAELGASAAFVGRVGADVPGQASIEALRACGVQVHVATDAELPTGTCVVLVDAGGERTMIPSPGANVALTVADVDAVALGAGDHLHVSGYALFGGARPAALHALDSARRLPATISIGAASCAPLGAIGAATFLGWARGATVFANAEEAEVLVATSDPAAAARAIAGAVSGQAVVTDGSRPAYWSDAATVVAADAQDGRVLDSTGAGDAFAAGFLAARLSGAGPERALAAGHATAAQACQGVGGRPRQR
jgi:sugar/nucleoside kinase (ribokinase family)